MKKELFSIIIFIIASCTPAFGKDPVQYVNPFNGTDFHGHTFPGAVYPFGMIQLSPDTRLTGWDGCSGYHYSDTLVYGFSHTHLSGTGASDYGDILLMPVRGFNIMNGIKGENYRSKFSHKRESASPGYYRVHLDRWGVDAELTTGKRAAMHRYNYNAGKGERGFIIDLTHRDIVLGSSIEIVNGNIIEGFRRSKMWADDQIVYFHIELSSNIEATLLLNDAPVKGAKAVSGSNCKAYIKFKDGGSNTAIVRIGISSVSRKNAELNLKSEVNNWDFESLKRSTSEAWNEFLSRIEVSSSLKGSEELIRTFYTALYHSAIHPSLYSDVNGEYRGMDRKVHKADGYDRYTVFSLWDTFRALHPLLTIIDEKRTNDFINSFLAIYREGGKLPIWELSGCETDCMIAYHSVPVITDSYVKGIRGFDANAALEAMIASSDKSEYGKEFYLQYGYLPAEMEHESVSKTLEYSYDDFTIATLAKELGSREVYNRYITRAQYYKNLFDPTSGFMRPKINGAWLTPFDPREVNNHFTEANSWQYSFFAPQDVNGHIKLLGGDEKYCAKLDELFSESASTTGRTQVDITGLIGQYAHGNEPSQHIAYLYSYAGKPWKTQEMVNKIASTLYSSAPDGICGNDDCGQTSAWFVMSSMGFYQVCPGRADYILGSPMFDKVIITLENGKKFTIVSKGIKNGERDIYIQSATLNGIPYNKAWFTHSDILSGSTLEFKMGERPNMNFGSAPVERPVSAIKEAEPIVENIWFEYPSMVFRDSMTISIKSSGADQIWYRFKDLPQYKLYKSPITIKASTQIEAYAVKGIQTSCSVPAEFVKVKGDRAVKLKYRYGKQYSAGGDEGIIDGLRGDKNFRLGGWQGYQASDFEAVVDLGSIKKPSKIGAGFLQDAKSWIWMPIYVEFSISTDGTNFSEPIRITGKISQEDMSVQTADIYIDIYQLYSESDKFRNGFRFLKIFAKNIGKIPQWHPGAGDEGYIFIDEIITD